MRRSSGRWALRVQRGPPRRILRRPLRRSAWHRTLRRGPSEISIRAARSRCLINAPIGGMRMSFTSEDDLSECAPMITPTAMSMTLPFMANSFEFLEKSHTFRILVEFSVFRRTGRGGRPTSPCFPVFRNCELFGRCLFGRICGRRVYKIRLPAFVSVFFYTFVIAEPKYEVYDFSTPCRRYRHRLGYIAVPFRRRMGLGLPCRQRRLLHRQPPRRGIWRPSR